MIAFEYIYNVVNFCIKIQRERASLFRCFELLQCVILQGNISKSKPRFTKIVRLVYMLS